MPPSTMGGLSRSFAAAFWTRPEGGTNRRKDEATKRGTRGGRADEPTNRRNDEGQRGQTTKGRNEGGRRRWAGGKLDGQRGGRGIECGERFGRLAQLARASRLHRGCRGFEPLTAHQNGDCAFRTGGDGMPDETVRLRCGGFFCVRSIPPPSTRRCRRP